jgi:molybdopterin molybdotransferase
MVSATARPGGEAATGERLISLEAALERLLQGVDTLGAEMAPLPEAAGRILAADVYGDVSLPPWDNSAMDGFAVRAADVAAAGPDEPVELRVVGEVAAGRAPRRTLRRGEALRILTGAPVPPGADAVVPIEDTSTWQGPRQTAGAPLPATVAIHRAVAPGAHLRREGEDVVAGDRLLRAGQLVGAGAVALAAAVGRDRFSVVRRPHLALLATGDEIVPPGRKAGPGQIHDANSAALTVLGQRAGALVRSFGIAPDELAAMTARLSEALAWADVVVVTGGVSVGARDVVKDAFEALGSVEFWRVAVQPGKPLAFGRAVRGRGAPPGGPVLLFGLPGNPVSSYVTFELFVRPALRRLAGLPPSDRVTKRAILGETVSTSRERRAFLRVRLEPADDPAGLPIARLSGGQGSHVLTALAAANGLAVVPEGVGEATAGTEVDVWPIEDWP